MCATIDIAKCLQLTIIALEHAPHQKLAELLGENSLNAEKFARNQVLIKYPPASSPTKLCHALQFH